MASDNKITVDEPLVSTDVDGLIRLVAERRKIALSELQQLCRIDKKNLDKWVRVLEDEGYISIEYGLRGTNVIWKGKDEYGPEPEAPVQPQVGGLETHAEEPKPAPAEEHVHSGEEPAADEAEPEELLSKYLARKREGAVSYKETASGADATAKAAATTIEPDVFSVKEITPEPETTRAEPEQVEAVEEEPEPIKEQAPARREPLQKPVTSVDTRELVNAYMDEINREKAKIDELKKEKERLYRNKFATVEGKIEADMVTLTEAILEKQSKVAELKERVLELPDKVEELEKLQEQLNRLREEGRGALERTGQKVDTFLRSMEDSKGDINSKVETLSSTIGREKDKVRELERLEVSVDARLAKLQAATEAVKAQIDELNEGMAALMGDIAQTADMRAEISVLSTALRETVAKHGEELDSLDSELQGIARIEHWVKEYIGDYEKKIDGIEQYVGRSEDELAELKESAESLYMNKYLSELHDITESYQSELGDAVMKERDIEQKIAASKSRISDLINDSQEMIKKLRSEPSMASDFSSMSAMVRERTEKIKATIDEKEKERVKLVEDSRSVRKTRAVSRAVSGGAPASRAAPSRSISKSVPKKKRK